jgi:translation initiation factor IF-3
MTRLNNRIRAKNVRVIYKEQSQIMPTAQALSYARNLGLDLVEVAANADPPVCRIVAYGKYKYDLSKKKKENPAHKTKIKEVQLRVRIAEHDYSIKMARAEGFLDHGDKLTIRLRFRGRENAHKELGFDVMKRVKEDLSTMAKVDVEPRLAGRSISMMVSPLPKHERIRKFKPEIAELELQEEDPEEEDEHDSDSHEEGHDSDSHEEEEVQSDVEVQEASAPEPDPEPEKSPKPEEPSAEG